MKEKEKKSPKSNKPIIIHPGTQAIIDDSLYDDAAKLQHVINKFLEKVSGSKKAKPAKQKKEINAVEKQAATKKKIVPVKKSTPTKKLKK